MGSSRHTRFGAAASADKKVKIAENPDNYLRQTPVWTFKACDKEHDRWSLCSCDNLWIKLLEKLSEYETQTWGQIISQSNGKNHYIEVEELCPEARSRLDQLRLSPDTVISLRLNGKNRAFGLRQSNVLQLLWLDQNHEVCPSHKKHT